MFNLPLSVSLEENQWPQMSQMVQEHCHPTQCNMNIEVINTQS